MKIWIVKHHQDNGECYSDRYTWDTFMYFSTYEKAYAFYCNEIMEEYLGEYSIIEQSLDTQEKEVLEGSPWGGYTRELWPEDDPSYYIDNPDYQDYDSEDNYDPYLYSYWNEDLEKWRYGGYADEEIDYLSYPDEDSHILTEDEKEELRQSNELLAWLETREIPIIREWLIHKGDNYQIFKEIEECEIEKLNKALDGLITL